MKRRPRSNTEQLWVLLRRYSRRLLCSLLARCRSCAEGVGTNWRRYSSCKVLPCVGCTVVAFGNLHSRATRHRLFGMGRCKDETVFSPCYECCVVSSRRRKSPEHRLMNRLLSLQVIYYFCCDKMMRIFPRLNIRVASKIHDDFFFLRT